MEVKTMTLKQWRKMMGYTLHQAAPIFDVSYVSVQRYESEERSPIRIKTLERIFEGTGGLVTPNDLFGFTPERIKEAQERHACAKQLKV